MVTRTPDFWIKHLLRRAGFGYTPQELARYSALGYEAAVDELLHPERVSNERLESEIKLQQFDFTDLDDLKRWWIYRMAYTARPLEEKMTLFWHGHFATSDAKVHNPYAMYGQNMLFRANALGNFHKLLHEVSQDPAMIIWLDNQQNKKGKPNENYAREIMELFTLGIGNYSERDIKEAARAFTGWQTRPSGFFFNARQHDYGTKSVLGVTGDLNGDDVVAILVKQKATSRFLATKLCKFFVSDEPPQDLVDRVANAYVQSKYSVRSMLRAIFTDPVFLSEKAYHAKIKSPAELVVGTIKALQLKKLDGSVSDMMARMGQDLFKPPNVKGWDGGTAWIATDTMMERFNFAGKIVAQKFEEMHGYASPVALLQRQKLDNASKMVDYFLSLLVDADVPPSARAKLVSYVSSDIAGNAVQQIPDERTLDAKMRGLVHLIMTLPTYQLA